jgi:hypothetical protein
MLVKKNSPIEKIIERWKDEENPKTALKNEYKAFHEFDKRNGIDRKHLRWLYGNKKSKR